ncbi:hypothetical protein SLS62_006373 [Diatrype stigma]|uniref:Uncharacterized protein n=1 Tax=Diatrype stigma TaxID=117547 RepID=A0AAN9YRC0_9PEZI
MAANPAASPPLLPHIHLLCMQPSASAAFAQALASHASSPPSIAPAPATASPLSSHLHYTVHNTYLADLPSSLRFDLAVSPANSYGILDGGFDDALSRAFGPRDDYAALTRAAQAELYRRHAGYLPPGACCLVRIPVEEYRGRLRPYQDGSLGDDDGGAWGCRYLALCPTMRLPSLCTWDRDVVYECIWSLLNAIDQHNANLSNTVDPGKAGEGEREDPAPAPTKIESILMTPLGTGTGGLSDDRWAKQAVLAMKHWVEAKQNPHKWSALNWMDLGIVDTELRKTYRA